MRRRAFMVVLALFMMTLFSVLGLAYVLSGSITYKGATQAITTQQAYTLAEAGIEDAKVKLQKDPYFPPPDSPVSMTQSSLVYTYSENVTDIGNTTDVGRFEVTVDRSYADSPYYLVVLTSTGYPLGNAIKTVRAEIDVCPFDRLKPANPNPNAYRIVNWSEEAQSQ